MSPESPSLQNSHVLQEMVFQNFFRKYSFFRKTCLIIKYPVTVRDDCRSSKHSEITVTGKNNKWNKRKEKNRSVLYYERLFSVEYYTRVIQFFFYEGNCKCSLSPKLRSGSATAHFAIIFLLLLIKLFVHVKATLSLSRTQTEFILTNNNNNNNKKTKKKHSLSLIRGTR